MTLLPSAIEIVVGILLLFGGGELFVGGSTAVALLLGIPQIVIGLTVVSLGTSAPELFVSLISTIQGGDAIAVSNVVGSNIFNVLVVLGLSALVVPLRVQSRLVRRDVPLLLGVSMAVWGMASGGRLTWQAGLALLVGTAINLIWEMRTASENPEESGEVDERDRATPRVAAAKLAGGLVLLVVGSQVLVKGATAAAVSLGVSQTVIGLTIVAAGTSMPEVATSVMAAVKGERDIAVGNVVGSNTFNILGCLGLSGLVAGSTGLGVPPSVLNFDIWVMLAVALACLPVFLTGREIARWEGAVFLAYYVAYVAYLILATQEHDALGAYSSVMMGFVIPLTVITLVVVMLRRPSAEAG